MMKQILFVRHAKSEWETPVEDKKRSLSPRGISDAEIVARDLVTRISDIEGVFSSPAKRAWDTCCIMTKILSITENISRREDLYDFDGTRVRNFIHKLPIEMNTVMLFGHNHAFTYLVDKLGSEYIENLPTAGAVLIKFNLANWDQIEKGETIWKITPKQLKEQRDA